MSTTQELIEHDIEGFLERHRHKSLLRFITCGSVDDGKSTLIGRLLFESSALFDDQLAAVAADSARWGTQGGAIDYALLVDGLAAEREQGITIDVAYRFFATETRKFIVADTPGHVQYTRNMVTGASGADAAVLMVDARHGVLTQTRRHAYLVHLLGVRHVVVAINKMDLVDYRHDRYLEICEQFAEFARDIGIELIRFIPLSALNGDNVVTPSRNMSWYRGDSLLHCLENLPAADSGQSSSMRMPVQWVCRPSHDFRGFAGTLASGVLAPGDRLRVQPSGKESRVARIVTACGDLPLAVAGQSVMLTLTDEIDVSRGDVLSSADDPAEVADQFEATLVWMHESPLMAGRSYLLKIGTRVVNAVVTAIKHQINVDTLDESAARSLELNAIGVVTLTLDQPVAFDPYRDNRTMGGFILIDRMTSHTMGAGMLHFALRRAHNIHRQAVDIDKAARADQKGQRSAVLWLTGLSGAGKSSIANRVETRLHAMGHHTYLLDGDNVRHGLNRDLGFTSADRVENIRRVGEVARLMVDAGLIVLTAFISPFRSERDMVRRLFPEGEFIEVHVDTPLAVAEARDVKGLYKKARSGELKNFTGIDSPYEPPESPELVIHTEGSDIDSAADRIIGHLVAQGFIPGQS